MKYHAKAVTNRLGLNHEVKILDINDIDSLIEKCSRKMTSLFCLAH